MGGHYVYGLVNTCIVSFVLCYDDYEMTPSVNIILAAFWLNFVECIFQFVNVNGLLSLH